MPSRPLTVLAPRSRLRQGGWDCEAVCRTRRGRDADGERQQQEMLLHLGETLGTEHEGGVIRDVMDMDLRTTQSTGVAELCSRHVEDGMVNKESGRSRPSAGGEVTARLTRGSSSAGWKKMTTPRPACCWE
eukprot:g7042.t1